VKVRWLRSAIRSRQQQIDYIAADNPRAAIDMDDAITASVRLLSEHPRAGRTGRVKSTREFVVPRTPYLIAYRVRRNEIVVLRILHAAQKWPTAF